MQHLLAQAVFDIIRTFPGVAVNSDIDFAALVGQDSLVSDPPVTITKDFHVVGWINKHFDIVSSVARRL
jgi:hypothetical protein